MTGPEAAASGPVFVPGRPNEILFGDLAEKYPERYQAAQLREQHLSGRASCPVCGHPTGDCTEGDHDMAAKQAARKGPARHNMEDKAVHGPGGIDVPGAGIKGADDVAGGADDMVAVKEDAYEERPLPGTDLTTKILVATGGTVITKAQADELKERGVKLRSGKAADDDEGGA